MKTTKTLTFNQLKSIIRESIDKEDDPLLDEFDIPGDKIKYDNMHKAYVELQDIKFDPFDIDEHEFKNPILVSDITIQHVNKSTNLDHDEKYKVTFDYYASYSSDPQEDRNDTVEFIIDYGDIIDGTKNSTYEELCKFMKNEIRIKLLPDDFDYDDD